ncbi:hypothetical protein IOD16_27650 [Saccharothrix sp. 6-C]|uniref:hypothetical protein n=1 Tax=Saccharothrix sp. 6-C TaxID=2781735 RepID=UPI0019171D8D|nr:hypothetical protein [Saccharothrix sp. 6-C]QQQ74881.1 hypothetical protein IOD16_27650 [Saccharothrix sp. 6-C]
MRVVDDAGDELNAEFSVQPDGEHLAVLLESAGGRMAGGGVRNADYRPGLEVLLGRLAAVDAVLLDALVDSRQVRDLAEDERRLIAEPVWLGRGVDVSALRRRLTSGQGRIGQRPGAPKAGNNSKRLRLRVDVPGYRAGDDRRLAHDIAWPRPRLDERFRAPDLFAALEDLAPHRQDGEVAPAGPLALTWAIGQLAAGHDRLFRWAAFQPEVTALLRDFGQAAAAQGPFWQLRSAAAVWETHGLAEEPTAADGSALAGFTEQAAELLADPVVRAQAAEVLRVTYLAGADHRALWRRVGLPVAGPPQALDVLRGLIGAELTTASGQTVEVVAVGTSTASATGADGQVEIAVDEVQAALDRLAEGGAVPVGPDEAVAAVVATVPDVDVRAGQVVPRGGRSGRDGRDKHFAELDGRVVAKYRKEQGELRKVLVGDAAEAPCALCGRVFPVGLLVAAHIKRRSVCDDHERNDLRNVAMLACSFGCDRLFEVGYVSVGEDGAVLVASAGGLDPHLDHLRGRVAEVFHERSAGYFRWHRRNVFRGRSGRGVGGVR